jgi:hypothetical protein
MRKCIAFDFILLYQTFFPLTIFSKCIAFHSYCVCIHWNEMYKTTCNRCASVFIHPKRNIQNEVPSGAFFSVHSPEMKCTKPSYRCLHLRRNTLEKNHYLFLHKDFDRSKKFSQFTFNGQNFFFLANTLLAPTHFCIWNCYERLSRVSS